MRKILTSFAFIAASLTFAQVGVNNEDPKATLHIDAKDNETSGILIPRLTRGAAKDMPSPTSGGNIQESTLIYVKELTGDQTGKAANIDEKGFYYFKDGAWVKLGGGAGTDTSLYLGDGELEQDRTVNQKNHNLKFTTGTGALEINGNSKLMGASYVNTTVVESGTSYTVLDTDYYISVSSSAANGGGQFDVIVPAASESNKGRVLIISNRTGAANLKLKTSSGQQIINGSEAEVIPNDLAEWIISDGTKWFNLINL